MINYLRNWLNAVAQQELDEAYKKGESAGYDGGFSDGWDAGFNEGAYSVGVKLEGRKADLREAVKELLVLYNRTGDHDHDGYWVGGCIACKVDRLLKKENKT